MNKNLDIFVVSPNRDPIHTISNKKVSNTDKKIHNLEKYIKELEQQKDGLTLDNSQLLAECCNAFLYLREQNTPVEIIEKIFPFSRLWEDMDLVNNVLSQKFPLVFTEDEKKTE